MGQDDSLQMCVHLYQCTQPIIPEENNLEEICMSEVDSSYVFLLINLMITLHGV